MYRFLQEKNINNFYKTIKSNFVWKKILLLNLWITIIQTQLARSSKTMNDCREVARAKIV